MNHGADGRKAQSDGKANPAIVGLRSLTAAAPTGPSNHDRHASTDEDTFPRLAVWLADVSADSTFEATNAGPAAPAKAPPPERAAH